MDLQLKQIRAARGYSQEEMANMLGIKTSRYGTWERGERMMNLEQAYNCAVVLHCTIDEIAGMPARNGLNEAESALVGDYRETHPTWQPETSDYAHRMAEKHPKPKSDLATNGAQRRSA